MLMQNPPHVGEILRELYLEPLNISITVAAQHLGVTRQALSRLVNEKTGISPEMAIRLGKAFATSPDYWMNLETQYELWQAAQKCSHIKIKPFDEAA
ncbi:MAG: HigA family addiction module antidote protein [Legionellales bacterium]|nr:HigA family addiction module antidote protein [Legionellales bacterium]